MKTGAAKGRRLRNFTWRALHFFAPKTVLKKYGYTCETIETDAPFLLVSNHVTDLDSFFVGAAYKKAPLRFVASEHIFRLGLVSKILNALLAPIPRSKAASGAGTVKGCLRALKNGDPVALFAEGDCTWDGLSNHVFPATGKLAKAAGVPLVTFRIVGGYFSNPRWAKSMRKGSMRGFPVRVYSAEELKSMTAEEVTAAIDRDIYEDAWQRRLDEGGGYASNRRAEGLERALVICPECGSISRLKSRADGIECLSCGMRTRLMADDRFEAGFRFRTIAEWDEWQKGRFREYFAGNNGKIPDVPPVVGEWREIDLSEDRVKGKPERLALGLDIGAGELTAGERRIPLSEIENMSIVKTNRLLFSLSEGYFEFSSAEGDLRKYLLAWQAAGSAE